VLLGQRYAPLGEVEDRPRGHVVQVHETRVGWQQPTPRRGHREAGFDETRAVHLGQSAGQRVGACVQVGGLDAATNDPAGQHVETGWHPSDDVTPGPFLEPDHRRLVEAQRTVDEGDEVFPVCGIVEPESALLLPGDAHGR